jgi:hypothetical protein
MKNTNSRETVVAQGWILMFLIFVGMLVMEFLNATITNNLSMYSSAEGKKGIQIMIYLMLMHAFVPMAVVSFKATWFRWFIAILTLCFGLLMVLHEVNHLFLIKDRIFGLRDALDFAHHGLAIWVACIAVRWAKEKTPQA